MSHFIKLQLALLGAVALAGCSSEPPPQSPEPTATEAASVGEASGAPIAVDASPLKVTVEQRKLALALVAIIARGGAASWERESTLPNGTYGRLLCPNAIAAPAKVPQQGEKITVPEADMTGDPKSGWSCLRFVLNEPASFQYSYAVSPPFKGKGRATEPKAGGFQACAEADFTPGGDTTLYCINGNLGKDKSIKLEDVQSFEE